jgi:protein-tyrosine phosphatase
MAAAMAQARLDQLTPAGSAVAGSAGVRATAGTVTEQTTLDVLAAHGVRATPRPARRLTEGMPDGSGLVLTADRGQRASMLRLRPSVLRRTFTLLEFARVAQASDADADRAELGRAQAVVRRAPQCRALNRPPSPDGDDVADPATRQRRS